MQSTKDISARTIRSITLRAAEGAGDRRAAESRRSIRLDQWAGGVRGDFHGRTVLATNWQACDAAPTPEMFTKAVAQAMQEAREHGAGRGLSVLRDLSGRRALLQEVIRFSIAVAIAASIATLLVMAIPSSQRPAGQDNPSLSAAWQSVKSSVTPAPQPAPPVKRAATLAVQDGSGFANDPVPLGIHVGAPPPGAFVPSTD